MRRLRPGEDLAGGQITPRATTPQGVKMRILPRTTVGSHAMRPTPSREASRHAVSYSEPRLTYIPLQKSSCRKSMQWLLLRPLRLGGSMWHPKLPTTSASQPHSVLRPVPAAAGTYVSPNGPQMANIQPARRPHRMLSFSSRARRWTVSHIFVSANIIMSTVQICRSSVLGGTRWVSTTSLWTVGNLRILGPSY